MTNEDMPQAIMAKLKDLILNEDNPRYIKDPRFDKLVMSIKKFPKMMKLRPIVVNIDMVVLGGNMRTRACIHAGLSEVPIIIAEDLDAAEQLEFIIKDNVGFGEWDFDALANEWDSLPLEEWGIEVPKPFEEDEAQQAVKKLKLEVTVETEDEQNEAYEKIAALGFNVRIK